MKEWTAGQLLSTSSSYWHACTLHAGVELDIFTRVGDERRSAEELAAEVDAAPRGIAMLLNGLAAMGLLVKKGELFANTGASRSLLAKDSPEYIGYIIMHHHILVDAWAQLEQAVRTGSPVAKRSHGEERERESFQLGMFNLAMAIAPKLAAAIDLSTRRHLLDLGGGPGTHAIHFCLVNPGLTATIFDRPTTRPFALETIKRFGVEERIDFVAGDFNEDEIPGRYDVAWLSQILHSNGPEECRQLIEKTASVMEPGGLMLIHDFFLDDDMAGPLFPALFSLNMLLNNPEGRSYSAKEVMAMLERAGIREIRRLPFQGPNDSYVISGVV